MCGYFCIGFIDFMLRGKSLLDYTNLLSLNDYKKNDKITLKSITKKPKISDLLEKTVLSIICSKCKNEDKKLFKKE